MKNNIFLLPLIGFLLSVWFISSAGASNPFTSNQTVQTGQQTTSSSTSKPALLNKVFIKIIIWQQYLKTKMTSLVRQARAEGSIKPIWLLILAAFAYGVIHAAGPGHGKAIALSYVLAQRPSYKHGLLFSNSIAFFHGVSGIVFVIFIRFVLNTSIMDNLDNVTNITQIVSYSIITCLGAIIFFHTVYKLVKSNQETYPKEIKGLNPVLAAAVVGCIPCPGVVIVMLFALSLDLFFLSIVLGLAISIGMGFTISIVVLLAISGKFASLNMVKKTGKKSLNLEKLIELSAGLILMILGLLFLGANF